MIVSLLAYFVRVFICHNASIAVLETSKEAIMPGRNMPMTSIVQVSVA
jgi:hypothetical protein